LELGDFGQEGHGDVLEQVVEIGTSGFVGHDDGGDPAAVGLPERGEGGVIASHGRLDKRAGRDVEPESSGREWEGVWIQGASR